MLQVRTVKTKDVEMKYVCFGEGQRNFVILPGLSLKNVTDSADAVAAAYDCFSKDYKVWLFDRRTDLPDKYTVREMARDTSAAFDALGIRDAYLFGASQGGMIAQFMAIDRPDLVHAMVLGSTASRVPVPDASGDASPDFARTSGASDPAGAAPGGDALSSWICLAKEGNAAGLVEAFSEMVYTPAFYKQYKDLILAQAEAVTGEDLRRFLILARGAEGMNAYDELGSVTCPVLVLGAGKDRVLGAEASREIADRLGPERCELYIYEDYGHAAYDEAPDYKERILRFFAAG